MARSRTPGRPSTAGAGASIQSTWPDSSAAVRKFRRDNGGAWLMAEDPDGRIALDWGVSGVPESFLVNPEGVVVAKLLGGVTEDKLEELLRAAKQEAA